MAGRKSTRTNYKTIAVEAPEALYKRYEKIAEKIDRAGIPRTFFKQYMLEAVLSLSDADIIARVGEANLKNALKKAL